MKTIVISANTSWYLHNFRKNTILELIKFGYRVVVVSPEDKYTPKLKALGADFKHVPIDQGGVNPLKDLCTVLNFFLIYRAVRPDLVLNFTPKNNIYSTLAASACGTGSINNIAGLGTMFIGDNFKARLVRLLYKVSQRKASLIFFQNEEDKLLFDQYELAPDVPVDRVPGSGVDLSRFSVSPKEQSQGTVFLMMARMIFDKGVGEYISAARHFKQKYGGKVEFRLLGFLDVNNPSAVSREQMHSWVEEGIVNYLGDSDQIEDEIAKADCVVLPSFYREGVPKSLLEAGAMAKPIITTDNVGCREVVLDGVNGYLCTPRDSRDLIEKMEKIVNMPHWMLASMGDESRKLIENKFDERIVIQKYIDAVAKRLG